MRGWNDSWPNKAYSPRSPRRFSPMAVRQSVKHKGDLPNRIEELLRELNRAKAYLWHGSPHRALRTLEDLTWDIGTESPRAETLQDKLEEFMNYIDTNVAAIPKATNAMDDDRRAHRLLQVRTRVLNQQLCKDFERWYPQLRTAADPVCQAA